MVALAQHGDPAVQGYDAVDAAYSNPPVTTEQILHPEKDLAGEIGTPESIPDFSGSLGNLWNPTDQFTRGEFGSRLWIEVIGGDKSDMFAAEGAAGWGGDTTAIYLGPDGEVAQVGKISWDDPATDSTEFLLAIEGAYESSESFTELLSEFYSYTLREDPDGFVAFGRSEDDSDTVVYAGATLSVTTRLLMEKLTESPSR